jgi:hypothetical protein
MHACTRQTTTYSTSTTNGAAPACCISFHWLCYIHTTPTRWSIYNALTSIYFQRGFPISYTQSHPPIINKANKFRRRKILQWRRQNPMHMCSLYKRKTQDSQDMAKRHLQRRRDACEEDKRNVYANRSERRKRLSRTVRDLDAGLEVAIDVH